MKKSIVNTTLGLIALATMSFATTHAQANHDNPQRFDKPKGHQWEGHGNYGQRHGQRPNHRLAEINARQAQQLNRIEQGMHNGALTHREYRALMSEQKYFRTVKRGFMSDGYLSPTEYRRLENGLNAAARNIRVAKRDDDMRTSHYENSRYGHRWQNYR